MADERPAAEAVAWAGGVVGARVVSHRGLREGSSPWLLRFENGAEAVLRLAPARYRPTQRTEIAALQVAARHGVPAPRLLAADVDGLGAVLITAIAGRSRIPVTATPGRLRALGEAAAAPHRVPLEPGPDLPQRTRPIESVDFAAMRRETGTSGVLAEAEALIAELPRPAGAVFVHGDLWQGNTLWSTGPRTTDEALLAIVDWDCAGSGHPGIDLGSLRCDAAIMYGVAAADVISAGWSAATGREPGHTAYWDAVAALSTPADLGYFIDAFADHGRGDLDRATAIARRDAFLQKALTQLDRAT